MIIGLDATPLSIGTGGVSRYTWELARALAENFPEDQYWLFSDQPFSLPDTHPANLRKASGPANPVERKWWLWGLNQAMIRHGVEVFHGTDFSVPYLKKRPAVMTLHDLSPWLDQKWQPDAGRVRRRTPILLRLGLASHIITPSEAVRHLVIERFRLEPECVVATPLAAGRMFAPLPGKPAPRPYLLFVGTMEPRKNVTRMIEAWRQVRRRQEIDLVLVGRTRSDFATPSPEPGLHLLGARPDEDLPALYSGALACLYPSLYEGFGLPVLEAMQCGAVVITSRDPAILEVTGGDAAIHVDATDTSSLTDAIRAIAQSPERFAALRDRAIARAGEFSWTRTAKLTREVYAAARQVSR